MPWLRSTRSRSASDGVVGGDQAALGGGEVLGGVQREAADPPAAGGPVADPGTMGLRSVLDDGETVPPTQSRRGGPCRRTARRGGPAAAPSFARSRPRPTALGIDVEVAASMSANRAVAPDSMIAFRVATNVNGLVMTSSPGCRSSTSRAAINAVVPLLTATTWSTPVSSANSSSSRLTSGPWAMIPDRSTLSTSSSASAPIRTVVIGIAGRTGEGSTGTEWER